MGQIGPQPPYCDTLYAGFAAAAYLEFDGPSRKPRHAGIAECGDKPVSRVGNVG